MLFILQLQQSNKFIVHQREWCHAFSNTHLYQLVYRVAICLQGLVLLVDTVSPVFQLYQRASLVVLSAKHGLFAPFLHY